MFKNLLQNIGDSSNDDRNLSPEEIEALIANFASGQESDLTKNSDKTVPKQDSRGKGSKKNDNTSGKKDYKRKWQEIIKDVNQIDILKADSSKPSETPKALQIRKNRKQVLAKDGRTPYVAKDHQGEPIEDITKSTWIKRIDEVKVLKKDGYTPFDENKHEGQAFEVITKENHRYRLRNSGKPKKERKYSMLGLAPNYLNKSEVENTNESMRAQAPSSEIMSISKIRGQWKRIQESINKQNEIQAGESEIQTNNFQLASEEDTFSADLELSSSHFDNYSPIQSPSYCNIYSTLTSIANEEFKSNSSNTEEQILSTNLENQNFLENFHYPSLLTEKPTNDEKTGELDSDFDFIKGMNQQI